MALSHLVSQHHAHKMWVFDYVLFWRLTDSCKSGVDETYSGCCLRSDFLIRAAFKLEEVTRS